MTNKLRNTYLFIFIFFTVGFGIVLLKIFNNNATNLYESFTIPLNMFYISTLILICIFYFSSSTKINITLMLVAILIIGLFIILFDRTYSPIDEAAHYDYINHIIDNRRLPTLYDYLDANTLSMVSNTNIPGNVPNHEAVQPPFYYLLMAFLTFFIKNYTIRFFAIRLIGLLFLFGIVHFSYQSLRVLKQNEVINLELEECFPFIILFLFNPGILLRFSRISNESFVTLLASILIYIYIKLIFNWYSKKLWWISNILLILIFLTKNTGIFLFGGLFIILIYQKKFAELIGSFIVFFIGITPWLVFNYANYNAFTGMKIHLDYVLPIVNPNRQKIDIIPDTINIFSSYINPQEVFKGNFYYIVITFVSVSIFVILSLFTVYSIRKCLLYLKNKMRFNYDEDEKKQILTIVLTALTVANIVILCIGTLTTYVGLMIGRYVYISAIPLICLGAIWLKNKKIEVQKTIFIVISCVISIGYMSSMATFSNAYVSKTNLIGSKVKSIEMSNVTDENWINGIRVDGTIILLNGEDKAFNRLIDRTIKLSDGQEAKIIGTEFHDGYTYLLIDSILDVTTNHSNILQLD